MPYLHMKFLDKQLQGRIDQKLTRLNKLRPLSAVAVAKLRERFSLEMTYNSNAIEGNSLTQKETFWVLSEGLTIKGKPLKDHLEAKDHQEALEYLYDLIAKRDTEIFSEVLIRNLQGLVVKETETETAGQYRKVNVFITGASHTPPEAVEVLALTRDLIDWARSQQTKLHPVELAAIFHHKFVYIHPFLDGNGRTARLMMNLILMRSGYPLVVILKNDRRRYYESLGLADKQDYEPFVRFIAQAVERSLDIYLATLSPEKIASKKFFPLSTIAKQTPYSGKYLNLLARQGKIGAHKEGRNWVATADAIKEYRVNL